LIIFSGAALALYCSMHYEKPLAGCIALSTFFPETRLPDPTTLHNKGFCSDCKCNLANICSTEIPYFQAHGESDNILPLSYGINTSKKLKQFLPNHEVCLERKGGGK
jgi:lysophospholipase-2